VTTAVDGLVVSLVLNEVEAYAGTDDPASHAFHSRTERNDPMFQAAGTVYVYRSYGIHWCMNIVAGDPEDPQGVLLRGGSVVAGRDTAIRRRGRADHLADGPGKLAQALAVDGRSSGSTIGAGAVSISGLGTVHAYETTPRIGISRATDREWRFLSRDSG
jgi:DNA-3-methyladenine glycosylase